MLHPRHAVLGSSRFRGQQVGRKEGGVLTAELEDLEEEMGDMVAAMSPNQGTRGDKGDRER